MLHKKVCKKNARKRSKKFVISIVVLILITLVILITPFVFTRTHFGYDTTIQGVDCSWLSVSDAKEKIENNLGSNPVTFEIGENSYEATYAELGINVSEQQLEELLEYQRFLAPIIYYIEDSINVDEEKVSEFLSTIPELQGINIVEAQNAYIQFDGSNFVIKEEVYGNQFDFDKALQITMDKLEKFQENAVVNLDEALVLPEILSTDSNLIGECNRLNNIFSTVLTFRLMDGSEYTLDKTLMQNWIVQEEGVNASINLEENIKQFVTKLAEEAENVTTVQFEATGVGYVTMPAFEERIPKVMPQDTVILIMEKLNNAESYTGAPVYDEDPVTENLSSYIEIDISRQRVFMYLNGECIVDTPTVTGSIGDGYYTPTGVFYLNNKVYDTVLRGSNRDGSTYASPVTYWMPFYRGYGMHDANWRNKFGGTIYKNNGSHGCVNLPENAAATIYNNITYEMPIFIYKSEQ